MLDFINLFLRGGGGRERSSVHYTNFMFIFPWILVTTKKKLLLFIEEKYVKKIEVLQFLAHMFNLIFCMSFGLNFKPF